MKKRNSNASDEVYKQYIREQQKKWRDANPEKVRAIRLKHRPPVSELTPEEREKRRADQREYYRKNREYLREYQRQWAKDNPEKVAERAARRKKKPISELTPEQAAVRRVKTKAYYLKNRDKYRAWVKDYKDRVKDAVAKQKQVYKEVQNDNA